MRAVESERRRKAVGISAETVNANIVVARHDRGLGLAAAGADQTKLKVHALSIADEAREIDAVDAVGISRAGHLVAPHRTTVEPHARNMACRIHATIVGVEVK